MGATDDVWPGTKTTTDFELCHVFGNSMKSRSRSLTGDNMLKAFDNLTIVRYNKPDDC